MSRWRETPQVHRDLNSVNTVPTDRAGSEVMRRRARCGESARLDLRVITPPLSQSLDPPFERVDRWD